MFDGVKAADVGCALRLGKVLGPVWLGAKYPQLTSTELWKVTEAADDVLKPGTIPQGYQYRDMTERKFIAAAWLCGASQAQLGQLFRKAQQTINQQINREFETSPIGVDKWAVRLQYTDKKRNRKSIPFIELVSMHENFQMMYNSKPDLFKTYTAIEVAAVLRRIPLESESEGSAYDAVPVPDSKVNNVVIESEDAEPVSGVPPEPPATIEPPKARDAFSPDTFDYSILK